ncbi:urease accessory protein UreD [Pseudotabrizicola sp. L79]|uniref:urease accessory protein UreD n=1 Tax=Pseudotabrizicola sp. L79 TaxID=3118402 RepID=UPI002F95BCB5
MNAAAEPIVMQRSRGEARVALGQAAGRITLCGLRQSGSAKVILPHVGACPEAVFLNTSGGLTGGDALSYTVDLDPGVVAVATTQTAERAYRSSGGMARVRVDLSVGAGGFLDWLPQETILFNGAALDRRTVVQLGAGAGCLVLEMVVLGRQAMGETVAQVALRDWRQISRADRPIWVEPLVLSDRALQTGVAGMGGIRAFASLCLVAPDAPDLLAPLRRLLDEPGVTAGASALPGRLMLRAHAADGWPLRRQIARCLGLLREGRPLPGVWQM